MAENDRVAADWQVHLAAEEPGANQLYKGSEQ